jgi:hypothetical protein
MSSMANSFLLTTTLFTCWMHSHQNRGFEMVDPFTIIGGVAATTQLSVYGYKLLVATAALPRHVRQAPDRIQAWLNQASTMMVLLDNAQSTMGTPTQGTASLIAQCRKDNTKLYELLQPRKHMKRKSNKTKILDLAFIMRRQSEVEQLMLSLGHSFQMLAMNLIL